MQIPHQKEHGTFLDKKEKLGKKSNGWHLVKMQTNFKKTNQTRANVLDLFWIYVFADMTF